MAEHQRFGERAAATDRRRNQRRRGGAGLARTHHFWCLDCSPRPPGLCRLPTRQIRGRRSRPSPPSWRLEDVDRRGASLGEQPSLQATNASDGTSSSAPPVQSAPVVSTPAIANPQREIPFYPLGTGSSSGDGVGEVMAALQRADSTSRTTISGVVFETTSRGRVPIANGFVGIEPDPELFRQIIGNSLLKPLAARLHDQELLAQVTRSAPIRSDGRYAIEIPSTLQGHLTVVAVALTPERAGRLLNQPCAAKAQLGFRHDVGYRPRPTGTTSRDTPVPHAVRPRFRNSRWTATARDRHRPILRPRRRSVRPLIRWVLRVLQYRDWTGIRRDYHFG